VTSTVVETKSFLSGKKQSPVTDQNNHNDSTYSLEQITEVNN